MRNGPKPLAVAVGEGCLSGALAAAITIGALSLALDDLLGSRHTRNTSVIVLLLVSPFIGAAIARMVLPASGGVNVAWLGSACFAGLAIGMATLPWQLWSPERAALHNTLWVATSVTVAGCAAAVWSRWRASRGLRWSVAAAAKLEQSLNSAGGRRAVAVARAVFIGLNTAVFLIVASSYLTAPDETNWFGLLMLTFLFVLLPAGFLALFALVIVIEIFPSLIEGYPFVVTLLAVWVAAGIISYRFWFVWMPRALQRKAKGPNPSLDPAL